ncbi:uncharacterized protein EI97DRAFT_372767 [Westerdykella ornata]|uniref:YMC020W-like alpha/beta hydrolase domain-containing protein n=1 Tax=Westerdykella ornata TaxID=318751 RepID=A0A6A6JQG2_WESOR|nr:uncharacterized protein EI97DRAFT_372767 [Westerdykella ornata]KAF2278782.1 hypothetical protein EI97DRAFT_372767 [Westerdykella ornata]
MGPRKRSKPNPKAPADITDPRPPNDPDVSNEATPELTPKGSELLQDTSSNKSLVEKPSTSESAGRTPSKNESRKWLGGGGSWRSKAPPIVGSSKESIGIGVAGGVPSQLPDEHAKKSQPQSPAKFLSKRKSSKGDAIPASMTLMNISSDGTIDQGEAVEPNSPTGPTEPPPPVVDEPPLPPDPPKQPKAEPTGTFGWRGWWSRPDGYSDPTKKQGTEEAQKTPLPVPTPSEVDDSGKELRDSAAMAQAKDPDTEMKEASAITSAETENSPMKDAPAVAPPDAPKPAPSSSWFWLWSTTQNAQARPKPAVDDNQEPAETNTTPTALTESEGATQAESVAHAPAPVEDNMPTPQQAPKPSGWAFWFSSKPKTDGAPSGGSSSKQVGEVAVFNTPSQSRPEAAQFNEEQQPQEEPPIEPSKPASGTSLAKRSIRSLRGRPKAKETSKDAQVEPAPSGKTTTPGKPSPAQHLAQAETAQPSPPPAKDAKKDKQAPPNLLLPEFKNTYHLVQKPTYWQQIRKYFLGDEPPMPHLHINPSPPKIRKAVAIGVHGFFPAPIVQRVLGQPTGTSIRFATAARQAIEDWTQAQGYSAEIEQIALEGEGFVSERVNTLWKLLLNWVEHIRAADFIMVACHSQGVPVAIMLVAKLIQFGCVNAARIGVCAMAGVNLGPFIEYKTKYFGPTAAELFEFSNPKSLVSQMYLAALDEVLRHGVRILYVGSIDDQLVSLESSTFSTISHPYIYRAVFVDGRIHAPDFLTHLVGFALKLRNLGLPDHGLIRELSPALAGSLYGGEGHSRLYDEQRVYQLAVQHALETTNLPIHSTHHQQQQGRRPSTSASIATFKGIHIPVPGAKPDAKDPYALRVKDYDAVGSGNQNPFFLPWAMRGLLEEEFVKKELGEEVEELLGLFEDWRPQGKQLKDVKFRLEAVKSRL